MVAVSSSPVRMFVEIFTTLRFDVFMDPVDKRLVEIDHDDSRSSGSPIAIGRRIGKGFSVFIVMEDRRTELATMSAPETSMARIDCTLSDDSVAEPIGFWITVAPSCSVDIAPVMNVAVIVEVDVVKAVMVLVLRDGVLMALACPANSKVDPRYRPDAVRVEALVDDAVIVERLMI